MTSKDTRFKKKVQRQNKREKEALLKFQELNTVLLKLISYFKIITLMAMSMLYKDACPVVRWMFNSYVKRHSSNNLTVLYYTLNHSNTFQEKWRANLLSIILSCAEVVSYLPILYIFDDTLVDKQGEHLELRSNLFDHNFKMAHFI